MTKQDKKRMRGFSRVVHLIDRIGKEISRNDEMRVVEAFNEHCPHREKIPWIKSVRQATEREDALKIDIVVDTTDVGVILLQIKGSDWGLNKFAKQQMRGEANLEIIALVINPVMDHEEIFRRVLKLISHERRIRLAQFERQHRQALEELETKAFPPTTTT